MPRSTKPRNHSATYQRRNEVARERGFKSYADQRKQFEQAGRSRVFRAAIPKSDYKSDGKIRLRTSNSRDRQLVKQYMETFYGPDADDYSVDGPKAAWFVGVLDDYTPDEWRDLYPNGVRESGMGMAA